MDDSASEPVQLYIYDLSRGLASLLSPALLGQQVEGVWHTSVVVFGQEYFYGGNGVTCCEPGGTTLGAPLRVLPLGETYVPQTVFLDYVQGLATTSYVGERYNLLEHNCNNFSEEVAQFLCGAHVPKDILELPQRVMSPAVRAALAAGLAQLNGQPLRSGRRAPSPDYVALNSQVEEARAAAARLAAQRTDLTNKMERRRRRREKKARRRGDLPDDQHDDSPDEHTDGRAQSKARAALVMAEAAEPDDRRAVEEQRRQAHPPLVYRDIDGAAELAALEAELLAGDATDVDRQSLAELRQYLVDGEGSWALGDDFLAWAGGVLAGARGRLPLLRCLAAAALRDDCTLLLVQDRRDHHLLSYAYRVEELPPDEQLAVATFMCNLFEHVSAAEWLLYISEWEVAGLPLCNIRVTTKVAVHALLSEDDRLAEVGSALMYNLANKEVKTVVFDDVCVELGMALAQFLSSAPREELLFRAVASLARLSLHSALVPQLLPMLCVQPDSFRGTSSRVDEQIDLLMTKVQ